MSVIDLDLPGYFCDFGSEFWETAFNIASLNWFSLSKSDVCPNMFLPHAYSWKEKKSVLIQISLKFVLKDLIDKTEALVHATIHFQNQW